MASLKNDIKKRKREGKKKKKEPRNSKILKDVT